MKMHISHKTSICYSSVHQARKKILEIAGDGCFVYDLFTLSFGLFYVQIALLSGSSFPCRFKINHSIMGSEIFGVLEMGWQMLLHLENGVRKSSYLS